MERIALAPQPFCGEGASCFRLGTDAAGNETDHLL